MTTRTERPGERVVADRRRPALPEPEDALVAVGQKGTTKEAQP